MTTHDATGLGGGPFGARSGSTRSSDKAYERRMRRDRALADRRLTRTGSPISSALTRVPFVVLVILLLTGGVVGVLLLNTMSDAAGLRASDSRLQQAALTTQIQAMSRSVQAASGPSVLASEARKLGLVPAGDAPILSVGADGKGTLVGTASAVAGAAPATTAPADTAPADTAPATTAPASTAPATAAPATTAPATTTPKKAAPGTTTAAPKTTLKVVVPQRVTPVRPTSRATTAKTTATKTAPKTATPRTTTPKTTASKTATPKTAAPKTTAPRTTARVTRAARSTTTATTGG